MIFLSLFGGPCTWIFAIGGGAGAAAGPNLKGMLMNANSAESRGTVFALFNLIDCLGKGLGPFVLVILSWVFGSRQIAFAIAFGLWFVAGWIEAQSAECLNEDTLAVEIAASNKQSEPFDLLHLFHSPLM